jgi:hypothetical protein
MNRMARLRQFDLKRTFSRKRQALLLFLLPLMLSACDIGGQIESIGSSIGDMFSGLLK